MFNLKFQETCGSYNGCSKGLKGKFVWRHRMLRKIHFSTAWHWLTCKLNIPSVQDQQHKGLVAFCRLAQPTIQLGNFHLICFIKLFQSNSSRIDLFPQYPIEHSVLNFFLSLKVFESELSTTTVGETWHRFFR